MNTTPLLRWRHFPVCVNRILAGCLALFILINGFIPRFALTGNDCRVLSQIIESQSILLKFFSLSTVPLTIVADLFVDSGRQNNMPKPADKQEGSGPNPSTDYVLTSNDLRSHSFRLGQDRSHSADQSTAASFALQLFASTVRCMSISPPGYFCFVIIAFLFLLPRSSIGEYASAFFRFLRSHAQLVQSSWVFYLRIKPNIEGSLS